MMPRTISEILIEADNSDNPWKINDLWNEIVENKYSYTIVELNFAREHTFELIKNLVQKDCIKIKNMILGND